MIMRLAHLLRDARGNSVMEFALFAPVLASFIVGISDLAMGLARKYQIEQASYRALEMITVGSLQTDYNAFVRPEAAAAAGERIENVTVTSWLECNGTRKPDFSDTCAPANKTTGTPAEETARFVKVEIVSDYDPTFAYMANLMGGADGKVRLTSRSTLRVQ